MSEVLAPRTTNWTAVDLVRRFGAIPLHRVRNHPAPGTATEEDVVGIHDHEDRLYELVDETLVEKTVGTYESYIAALLARFLGTFVSEHDSGIVLGADGMVRLAPGLVRIPDVSFISWGRLPSRRIPEDAIADLVPDLVVEVISRSNTQEEMDRKLRDYLDAGVRLVWHVYPEARDVRQYGNTEKCDILAPPQVLDAGNVLPGFTLSLVELFARPSS